MSPILVRPVREQLEHDRVIRLLQVKLKRKHEVIANIGEDQSTSIKIGQLQIYPDLVLTTADRGRKLMGTVEVETSESVNHLEARSQWAHLGRARAPFHLYVPLGSVDIARRLAAENHVHVTELWSFHTIGDQTHFRLVQRTPDDTRRSSEPRGIVTSARPEPPKTWLCRRRRAAPAAGEEPPPPPPPLPAKKGPDRACRPACTGGRGTAPVASLPLAKAAAVAKSRLAVAAQTRVRCPAGEEARRAARAQSRATASRTTVSQAGARASPEKEVSPAVSAVHSGQAGYENTFVVESDRRRGRSRTRVLYWFRTPPGVKVGRAALDEDAIRLIEAAQPRHRVRLAADPQGAGGARDRAQAAGRSETAAAR